MVVKCPKCGKLLEVPKEKLSKKEVCEHCEHIFVVDDSVMYKEPQPVTSTQPLNQKEEKPVGVKPPPDSTQPPKKKSASPVRIIFRIILGVILGILLIYVGLVVLVGINKGMKESGVGGILPPQTYQLTSEIVNIPAGNIWYQGFSCSNGTRLVGSVVVASYDVHVWLLQGEDNLRALRENKQFQYFPTASGQKISAKNIDCVLSEGTYYFVIDNSYSIFRSKQVTVTLSLVY